ncbi:exoribonuclease II [Thaumasiovibrio subtropicus]|uniref:exoribonuclease II n=1 Tax=Thaumasiovibrio subtropicus TaxID=1891207 RepID=UPI000B34FE6A|nr:exoribonuclease II [Thaumasiovibrio subtropicus]
MFQDNPLLAQLKKDFQEALPKKEGTIKATDRGFGFLEVDNSKDSFFIPPSYMKKVMHGDKVSAFIRNEKDREVAEPEALIEASVSRFIGRVKLFKGRLNVIPDHPQIKDAIKAKTRKGLASDSLSEGDWVVAHITRHPLVGDNKTFFCEISRKIASSEDKGVPWWVTLAKHDLPDAEPAGIENWEMHDEGLTREDLTHVPFVTIDGESTKDMDDALYAEKNDDGSFKVTVAIADPTSYIAVNDEMDAEARKRGFTVYLPGRNIPMLPRELSDELCSLKQDEKRPALVCEMEVAADGTLSDDIRFFSAWIQSQARLAYDHVSDYLENGHSDAWQPNDVIAEQVANLHAFANARTEWRTKNAVIFPDRPDYRFELSEDNDVVAIHIDARRTANRMVEEAMITANICAGRVLAKHFDSGVFNSHAGFNAEKMNEVMDVLKEFNAPFDAEQLQSLDGFSALRRWLNEQETSYLDNRMRKFQAYSEVGNKPLPHYAMGLDVYATWTSPIRKYGDMINHRMLKAVILSQEPVQQPDETVGEEMALHRRVHRMAERDVGDWLYVQLLQADLKNETVFTAEIFDINRAGMRVRLLENGAMAFVPGPLIMDNKARIECVGESGIINIDKNKEYQLGDQIEVKLADIKAATRSIVAKPIKIFPDLVENAESDKD